MKVLRTPQAMSRQAALWKKRGLSVGFVPTMGALHAGHLSLIERSVRENDRTVVSIFVNPLQFGPNEDYTRYPRPFAKDARLARGAGADALYHPSVEGLYPEGFRAQVEVPGLSEPLDGRFRPGHFRGVATVVLKLLQRVGPDRAYFGEKDFQQLAIVRRMALDLDVPARIVGCPTVREKDGLALSSRNAYLSPEERARAPAFHRALQAGAAAAKSRGATPAKVRAAMRRALRHIPGIRVDYLSVVDAATLQDAVRLRGTLRILGAIRIGRTRLIDNIPLICNH